MLSPPGRPYANSACAGAFICGATFEEPMAEPAKAVDWTETMESMVDVCWRRAFVGNDEFDWSCEGSG
eukprot:scaffold143760_cov105-Phaeocystis_antarctica.AAC.1